MKTSLVVAALGAAAVAREGVAASRVLAQTPAAPLAESLELKTRSLGTGLDWVSGTINIGNRSVKLSACRVSLSLYRIAVAIPESREKGDTLASFLDHFGGQAVVSGGFLKSFYPPIPLGFVMRTRTVLNRSTRDDLLTGMLTIRNGRPSIGRFSEASTVGADDALQTGPLLLVNGQAGLPPTTGLTVSTRGLIDRRSARAFVALLAGNRFLVGHTEPMTLPELVSLLTASPGAGGLDCVDALNLSGSTDAGLLVRSAGGELTAGSQHTYLANAIIARAAATKRK